MRAAVMGEPALLQLSTKSCRRLAACRACCAIRGASVSARQHMSVRTLHKHQITQAEWRHVLLTLPAPKALTADHASPSPACLLYLHTDVWGLAVLKQEEGPPLPAVGFPSLSETCSPGVGCRLLVCCDKQRSKRQGAGECCATGGGEWAGSAHGNCHQHHITPHVLHMLHIIHPASKWWVSHCLSLDYVRSASKLEPAVTGMQNSERPDLSGSPSSALVSSAQQATAEPARLS